MKIAKIVVFATFMFPAAFYPNSALAAQPSAAFNLPAFTAKDISALTADLKFPEPAFTELLPRGGKPPVVITVSGLKFREVGWGPFNIIALQQLYNSPFYGWKLAEQQALEAALKDFPRLYAEVTGTDASCQTVRELPDNYIETHLQALPEYAAAPFTIIPFLWSRDPADSDMVIPGFAQKLAQTYDTYKDTGRPIYVFTHSWGSVLMHDAMHRLARTRPDVKIDKFISTGSPLIPSNAIVRGFMAIERRKEGLMTEVSKPAIVRVWTNIWAARDAFSNAIPAADNNIQADTSLEKAEPLLIEIIINNPILRELACKDLIKLRNIITWHKAYIYDFSATLDSLKKNITLTMFRPLVAAQVIKTRPAH